MDIVERKPQSISTDPLDALRTAVQTTEDITLVDTNREAAAEIKAIADSLQPFFIPSDTEEGEELENPLIINMDGVDYFLTIKKSIIPNRIDDRELENLSIEASTYNLTHYTVGSVYDGDVYNSDNFLASPSESISLRGIMRFIAEKLLERQPNLPKGYSVSEPIRNGLRIRKAQEQQARLAEIRRHPHGNPMVY